MANKEQLEMLRRSVEEWNEWRKENPDVEIDLGEADLSGVNLFTANLSNAKLCDADLSCAKLFAAIIFWADFSGADLSGVSLLDVIGLATANFEGAFVERKSQKLILAAVAASMRDPEPKKG